MPWGIGWRRSNDLKLGGRGTSNRSTRFDRRISFSVSRDYNIPYLQSHLHVWASRTLISEGKWDKDDWIFTPFKSFTHLSLDVPRGRIDHFVSRRRFVPRSSSILTLVCSLLFFGKNWLVRGFFEPRVERVSTKSYGPRTGGNAEIFEAWVNQQDPASRSWWFTWEASIIFECRRWFRTWFHRPLNSGPMLPFSRRPGWFLIAEWSYMDFVYPVHRVSLSEGPRLQSRIVLGRCSPYEKTYSFSANAKRKLQFQSLQCLECKSSLKM